MVAVVLVLPLWGILLFVIVATPWQPIGMRALWYVAAVGGESIDSIERVAGFLEGAVRVEQVMADGERTAEPDVSAEAGKRADRLEGAGERERADRSEGADTGERAADASESADRSERADRRESAEPAERAGLRESAGTNERAAEPRERAVTTERATNIESAVAAERAAKPSESADRGERAASSESADANERPRFKLGYPRINSASHHLWDAQQAGWPQHLPHEAWRDLASAQRREDQPRQDSADHPAFAAGYVPNDAATPQVLSEAYIAKRQGKARR